MSIKTYEDFLEVLNGLVADGRVLCRCPKCSSDITANYLQPFNKGSTRCNTCATFIDNDEVLYLPVSN